MKITYLGLHVCVKDAPNLKLLSHYLPLIAKKHVSFYLPSLLIQEEDTLLDINKGAF